MISAGHIKCVSESEPSDYENCSSSDDRLGTDVGTSAKETLVMFNLTGLNYFRHFSSRLPQYFIMSVFIQSLHISTCKKLCILNQNIDF